MNRNSDSNYVIQQPQRSNDHSNGNDQVSSNGSSMLNISNVFMNEQNNLESNVNGVMESMPDEVMIDSVDEMNNGDGLIFPANPYLELNSNALSHIKNILLNLDFQSLNLNEDDNELVEEFQKCLQNKITAYLKIIESRRKGILKEIEQDNSRLKKLNLDRSPQVVSFINKLQRVRLRAMETETIEIQKLRMRLSTIVEQYKVAMQNYSASLSDNKQVINPTPMFQNWVQSIDTNENTNLSKSLQNITGYSKKIVDNILDNSLTENSLITVEHPRDVFPLSILPSEILHLVLEKLSHKTDIVNYLSVCKIWAQLIVKILYYRPHINKKSQLDLFMRTMSFSGNQTLFDYRSMIKRLNFSFVGDYLHNEQLHNFVGCQNLERLTLVFCKHITSQSISEVLKGCNYLQSVDITGIKEISDNIFITLAQNCSRLQGFYVPQAKNVSFASLKKFLLNTPILKRVKITGNENVNDDLVEILAEKCPMLVEVDFTSSPNVNDGSLTKLITKLTQLREFRITHNTNITDKLFLSLPTNITQLPALRLLDLSGCENVTDKTIERIIALAPKLRNVFLGKCSRITDTSLYHLARLGKNLQTIHFGHCFNITDQGVRVLVQSCPRIHYVDFACCTNLTNRTLYELSDLTKLKRIGLVKCSQMTDEGLLNMLSLRGRNDSLERVHLSYCSNLTIYPIYELLMACPKLSHLSLTAVPSFLRPDITAFCRPAPADFSENQRQIFCVFSGKGVHKLRHYLMSLTTPTNGPQTDIREILTKYIASKNLLETNEQLEDGIRRITTELNQDSSAILAAAGVSQMNGVNNDLLFQNIDFERMDEVFSWFNNSHFDNHINFTMNSVETNQLLSLVDRKFCEDPFDEDYDETDGIVAPGANHILNTELCHIVRKFHELDDRVDDFEVNVSSLARVQFQFTGFLLHEMVQIYMQMVDLNRQVIEIQTNVVSSNLENNMKGIFIWRLLFNEKFTKLLQKFKLSTVVLRLYLKDSIALLTRQRELMLAHQRNTWNNINDDTINTNTFIVSNAGENRNTRFEMGGLPITNNDLNLIEFQPNFRITRNGQDVAPPTNGINSNELEPPLLLNDSNQTDTHSDTPDDDTILEDA